MTVRFLKVRTRGHRQVGLTISIKAVSFRCFVQRFSNDFTSAAATISKRPSANIRDRTETLGGACCVCWLQTGHHIVGGRMPREKRISLSIAFSRSRRAILAPTRSLASTLAQVSIISETTVRLASPQASTRLLGRSQPPDLSSSTQDQMVITIRRAINSVPPPFNT